MLSSFLLLCPEYRPQKGKYCEFFNTSHISVRSAVSTQQILCTESITISKDESSSHWHQKDYRSFNASSTWETADFASAPPVYSLPVTSAFCDPADGDTCVVSDGHIELRGTLPVGYFISLTSMFFIILI